MHSLVLIALLAWVQADAMTLLEVDAEALANNPEIRSLVVARSSEIVLSTPQELGSALNDDIARYRKIMATAGIEPQ